jgi:endonuclease G
MRLLLILCILSFNVWSHGGRLASDGCHNDRKAGERHCHGGATESKKEPIKQQEYVPQIRSDKGILELNYEGFTVWVDCKERAPIKFRYNVQKDTGNFDRHSSFYLDNRVPPECQQKNVKAYGNGYDRGHQVPANHLDFSKKAIRESNYMVNILPQVAGMNRGAWLQTEMIIECYRDIDELLVVGGVIWGDDTKNDLFIQSHGVRTPDAFWKVIIRGSINSERVIGWIIPNISEAKRKNLDDYLVSINDIEKLTGEKLPIAEFNRNDDVPYMSWQTPIGCDRS